MNIYVYLDHNIIDDISKGDLSLKPSDKVIWVYSNENLVEIKRSGDTRFLNVLESIKARKIELDINSEFKLVGTAKILEYQSPYDINESYLETISGYEIDEKLNNELMSRLFGGDNKKEILSHPETFEENIKHLLQPHGLYTNEIETEVKKVRDKLDDFVNGPLQDIKEIEKSRELFGTHNGRAGNLSNKDNPIEEIWKILEKSNIAVTSEQFFGFEPFDKQGYSDWPMFLGIVGCHTILNYLGFSPDKGISKAKDIPNIASDGTHIAFAAYCTGLLSRDKKFIAKAKAIYSYKNIGTKVFTYKKKG